MYASVAASWATRCSSDAQSVRCYGALGGTSSPVSVSKMAILWVKAWNLVLQSGHSSDKREKQSHFNFLLVLSISWTFEMPSCFNNYTDLYSIKLLLVSMPSSDSFASQKFVQVTCVEVRFPHLTRNTWSLAITQRIVAVWSTRSLYAKCRRIKLNFLDVLRWAYNLLRHRSAG